jgi:hypothetical protein
VTEGTVVENVVVVDLDVLYAVVVARLVLYDVVVDRDVLKAVVVTWLVP